MQLRAPRRRLRRAQTMDVDQDLDSHLYSDSYRKSQYTPRISSSYQAFDGEDDATHPSAKDSASPWDNSESTSRINESCSVLQLDATGSTQLLQMTRHDILVMARDAARVHATCNTSVLAHSQPAKMMKRKSFHRNPSRVAGKLDHRACSAVCDVHRVNVRDLRRLFNGLSGTAEPTIMVRRQAILVSIDPIHAVILRNKCLVLLPDNSELHRSLVQELHLGARHEQPASCFEFKSLEALLTAICRIYESRYETSKPLVVSSLQQLTNALAMTTEPEVLRTYKNAMNELETRVDGIRRCLMDILDDDEGLRLLYMTKLYQTPSLLNDLMSFDSEEAEALIENYLHDIYTTRTKAHLLLHRIQTTESLVTMQLDTARNYLLGVDLVFELIALGAAVGAFVAGAFGMNLPSGVEHVPYLFWSVVVATFLTAISLVVVGIWFFQSKGIFFC